MKNKPNVFFPFDFVFFSHILYKGKHLGIQQSLTWQTEEQRNIGRTGNKKKMKEGEQEVAYIIPSIKVCQHEYKLMNTEVKNKATFSQRIHKNHLGFCLYNEIIEP